MATVQELLVRFKGDTKGLRDATKKAEFAVNKFGNKVKRVATKVKASFSGMHSALLPLLSAFAAVQVIKMADQFQLLSARIKNSTRNTDEFNKVFAGLQKIASNTGSELETSIDVFQRLSFVRDQIGATAAEMLIFTDNVQKLGVVSGASTVGLQSGLMQLGQALGSGILRAEEFNSIIENTPAIADAIAKGLKTNVGELRNMVLAGKVTSKEVFDVILKQTADINEQFAKFPITSGRAFNKLKLEAFNFIGALNKATGASNGLVNVLNFASDAIQNSRIGIEKILFRFAQFGLVSKQVFNDMAFGFSEFVATAETGIEKLSRGLISFKRKGLGVIKKDFTDEIIVFAEKIDDVTKKYERLNKKIEKGVKKTPTFDSSGGIISPTTKPENITKQADKAEKGLNKIKTATKEVKNEFEDMNQSSNNAFNGLLKDIARGENALDSLRSTARNVLNDIINNVFSGASGSGGGGGGLGGLIGGAISGVVGNAFSGFFNAPPTQQFSGGVALPTRKPTGFATGGQFTVGGRGGTDNNMVKFRASAGERVTIETPAQQKANGGGGSGSSINLVQNLNFSTGVSQTVRAEVMGMLPLIEQQTLSAVQDAQQRGKM